MTLIKRQTNWKTWYSMKICPVLICSHVVCQSVQVTGLQVLWVNKSKYLLLPVLSIFCWMI
jgi:hypothetical protein